MDKLGEALVALVVLSIIIERGLAIIFDTKAFRLTGDQKAMIAIGVSAAICFLLNFDIITLIPKVCADCGFGTNRLPPWVGRSEEHTSELQSLMRISYAVFCL